MLSRGPKSRFDARLRNLCAIRRSGLLATGILLAFFSAGCSNLEKAFEGPYCPIVPPPGAGASAGEGRGTLHAKALAYEEWFERLEPRFSIPSSTGAPMTIGGGALNAYFEAPLNKEPELGDGVIIGYGNQPDAAIWTGVYLAARAFRYAATTDSTARQAALEKARQAIDTLGFFIDVTGKPGYLARFAGPCSRAPELLGVDLGAGSCTELCQKVGQGCTVNTSGPFADYFWFGNTSRDQYSGFFFGMGTAYRLIHDDTIRASIRSRVRAVVDGLEASDWKITGRDGKTTSAGRVLPLMQLSWAMVSAEILGEEYCQVYEKQVQEHLLDAIAFDNISVLNLYMQYYGFDLDFLDNYNLILLEPNRARRQLYLESFQRGTYDLVRGTQNVFFDNIARAVGVPEAESSIAADREALLEFPSAPNRNRNVYPAPRPLNRDSLRLYELDASIHARFPSVRLTFQPQSEDPYPIRDRCSTEFLWQRSPTTICCTTATAPPPKLEKQWPPEWREYQVCQHAGSDTLVYPGVDYLVAYWMSRYYGTLDSSDRTGR